MNDEADAPGVGVAQASPVGSSYSNVQTRPASLEHAAGPRSLEAAGDASGGRRQVRATTVAGDASHCAATSERADLLGEELTCILEFINAKDLEAPVASPLLRAGREGIEALVAEQIYKSVSELKRQEARAGLLLVNALQLLEEQKLENAALQKPPPQEQQQADGGDLQELIMAQEVVKLRAEVARLEAQKVHAQADEGAVAAVRDIGGDLSYIEHQGGEGEDARNGQQTDAVSMAEHLRVNQELLDQVRWNQELLQRLWKYENPQSACAGLDPATPAHKPLTTAQGADRPAASTSIPLHRQHNAHVTPPSTRVPCRPASAHPDTYSQPRRAQHVFMPEMDAASPDECECECMSPKRSPFRSPPPRSVPSTRHSGRASSSYVINQSVWHDPPGSGGREREIPSPHARGNSSFRRSDASPPTSRHSYSSPGQKIVIT